MTYTPYHDRDESKFTQGTGPAGTTTPTPYHGGRDTQKVTERSKIDVPPIQVASIPKPRVPPTPTSVPVPPKIPATVPAASTPPVSQPVAPPPPPAQTQFAPIPQRPIGPIGNVSADRRVDARIEDVEDKVSEQTLAVDPSQPKTFGQNMGDGGMDTDYVKIRGIKYLEATFVGTKQRYLEIDKSTDPPTITWVGAMPDIDGPFKETFDTMKNHIHITGMTA